MTNRNFGFINTNGNLAIFLDGKQYTAASDHPNHSDILEAIKSEDYDALPDLIDLHNAVRTWLDNDAEFELVGDRLKYQGESFSFVITDKVISMIEAGNPADSLFNFLRKVRENPSKIAQDELLLFCEANGFMIHADGDILAYKAVRADYTDIHSGTVDNHVSSIPVVMERFKVDDERTRTCSTGLHFASYDYATTWHGRSDAHLMIMKINPKNVVSIPDDYNNQKGRCCEYVVFAEIPHNTTLPKLEVYNNSDIRGCAVGHMALDNCPNCAEDLNGSGKCPNCEYCPDCREALDEDALCSNCDQGERCAHCGEELDFDGNCFYCDELENDEVCLVCGNRLIGDICSYCKIGDQMEKLEEEYGSLYRIIQFLLPAAPAYAKIDERMNEIKMEIDDLAWSRV